MALKESIDRTIRNRMNRLAEEVKIQLLNQVPAPGKNPYATGALRSSLTARAQKRGDNWSLSVGYFSYGVYTNLGTGRYNVVKYGSPRANMFFLPPYRGYNPGKKGIKPQYWLSLNNRNRALSDFREGILKDYKKIITTSLKQNLK